MSERRVVGGDSVHRADTVLAELLQLRGWCSKKGRRVIDGAAKYRTVKSRVTEDRDARVTVGGNEAKLRRSRSIFYF